MSPCCRVVFFLSLSACLSLTHSSPFLHLRLVSSLSYKKLGGTTCLPRCPVVWSQRLPHFLLLPNMTHSSAPSQLTPLSVLSQWTRFSSPLYNLPSFLFFPPCRFLPHSFTKRFYNALCLGNQGMIQADMEMNIVR